MRRFLLALLTGSLVLVSVGCGGPRPAGGQELSWDDVAKHGYVNAGYAIQVAPPFDPLAIGGQEHGYLGLVAPDGAARFLDTGEVDAPGLAWDDGVLCVVTSTAVHRLTSRSARRTTYADGSGSVEWVGVGPGGTCIAVTAGRAYWEHDGRRRTADLPVERAVVASYLVWRGALWMLQGSGDLERSTSCYDWISPQGDSDG